MAEDSPDDPAVVGFRADEQAEADPPFRLDGYSRQSDTRFDVPARESSSNGKPEFDSAVSRAIENEIIPRLLMAHRTAASDGGSTAEARTGSDEIEELVALATHQPFQKSREFIDRMRARGVSVDAIVGEVLPAAAHHVGWLWETDACTFVDVTFALSRLQQLLRHYAPSLERESTPGGEGRRVLLSVMPGEQHTFAVSVLEELMRSAAWDAVSEAPREAGPLLRRVSDEWFDIVGLSAYTDGALHAMPELVPRLRAASVNRSVRIIIGGAAVLRHPELAAVVGADAIASDPANGMQQMESMIRSLRQPC